MSAGYVTKDEVDRLVTEIARLRVSLYESGKNEGRFLAERQQAIDDVEVYREEVRQVTEQMQQAIDERDAAILARHRVSSVRERELDAEVASLKAQLQQAIDALREIAQHTQMSNVTYHSGIAVTPSKSAKVARAALLNLGEQPDG